MAAGLLVLALRAPKHILVNRQFELGLVANLAFLLFFLYCAISIAWSDYPTVAGKRWIKALGDLVMIAIILTDRNPRFAMEWLTSRLAFAIMPLSILLARYFSGIGRGYDRWEGTVIYTGASNNKNMMGMTCLVLGISLTAYFLRLVRRADWKDYLGPLAAYGMTIVLLLWVLWLVRSMTSIATLALVCGLMLAMAFTPWLRNRALLGMAVGILLAASVYGLILNPGAGLAASLGKDATLTGRTDLWRLVLSMTVDPMIGAGYESFWLGDRLERLWSIVWWRPNQAHNGYLEVFLNLGWLGIFLLGLVLLTGFGKMLALISRDQDEGMLRVGIFVAILVYNLTESAFKLQHPLWLFLLWAIMSSHSLKYGFREETLHYSSGERFLGADAPAGGRALSIGRPE
jgi:O-antigen ligase